jgi:hypothetical protein
MKLASEVPASLLHESWYKRMTDYDFVIASHCLQNNEYYQYYCQPRGERELYLDNGAFENGKSIDVPKYLEIIKNLSPNVVVLPDVVNDCFTTVMASKSFLNDVVNSNSILFEGIKFMFVLQGKSMDEYLYSFEKILSIYHVSLIGVPYHQFYRPTFFKKTNIIERCIEKGVKIHILGLPNPFELVDLLQFGDVMESFDTSLPVVSGLHNKLFDLYEWQSDKVNINFEGIDASKQSRIVHNFMTLRHLIGKSK